LNVEQHNALIKATNMTTLRRFSMVQVVFSCLVLFFPMALPARAAQNGFGGYTFGMTEEQAKKVSACSPYTVSPSGGLYCHNYDFAGQKRYIDLYFGPQGLNKIMFTFMESDQINLVQMEKGIADLVSYLTKTYGALESPDLPNQEVTKETLFKAYNAKLRASGSADVVKIQLKPQKLPADLFIFSSIATYRFKNNYSIISLYFQPPRK
jgi:hypothetical protein